MWTWYFGLPSFDKIQKPTGAACIRFIFTQEDLELLQRLQREIPEKICFVSEIEPFGSHPVTDSSTRYGYFIAAFDSIEEKEEYMDHETIH